MHQQSSTSPPEHRYQSIFEHAAVSLWEADISRLRSKLAGLRRSGSFDLREQISRNPEFVRDAVSLVQVTDVNQATLRLFEAERKEQFLGPLDGVLRAVAGSALNETILAINDGRSDIELESAGVTLKGRKLSLLVKTHIPAEGAAHDRMLVSIIDITDRVESEERERRSAVILRGIINSSPDSIMVKDTSLRMVLCNTAFAAAIGKTPEEVYGKTDIENGRTTGHATRNAENAVEGWEKDELAVLSGKAINVATERSGPDKGIHYYETVKFPLRDQEGSVIGLVAVGRDVTERRRAELELARERTLFSTLMEHIPDFIYFKDQESRFIRVSRSLAMAQGLRGPSDALGKTDRDFLPPPIALEKREEELRIMRTGDPLVAMEEKLRYVSGPDVWQITTKLPLRDAGGAIVGTFGISHDITRRKQLEAESQRLAALVEFSDDAIVGIDLGRRITVWNRGAERIYGYTAEEMVGSQTSLLIPREFEEEALLIRERVLRGDLISHYGTTRLRKDGTRIQVSLTLSAVRDPGGRVLGMASVARDVTEEKAHQAQIDRAQRLESVATITGGIAHQFNNINTVVLGYLDLMISDNGLAGRLREFAEKARVAVQRSVDITSRLLAMTDPGKPAVPVSLNELARRALAVMDQRMREEHVVPDVRLGEAPPVEVDESRVQFVLSTLLNNALDSLLDQPVRKITLRSGSGPEWIFVEVEDTGCGIPAEDQRRVFTPFFSAKGEWAPPGSPQARVRGVGLSLAISQAILNGHGGRIEVRSTPGAGSTFRVLLPPAPLR